MCFYLRSQSHLSSPGPDNFFSHCLITEFGQLLREYSSEQRLSGLCALKCVGHYREKLNAVAFKVLIFYLAIDRAGSTHDYRGSHHRVNAIVLQRRAVGMTDYGQRKLSS